jgi:hypothetical protein
MTPRTAGSVTELQPDALAADGSESPKLLADECGEGHRGLNVFRCRFALGLGWLELRECAEGRWRLAKEALKF